MAHKKTGTARTPLPVLSEDDGTRTRNHRIDSLKERVRE